MGIIAWIVLGLVAGLLANMLIPGKRSQGLILTCLIGIAGALSLSHLMASQLYGVRPTDPITFVTVAALLMIVSLAASYIPSRRAMRVEPMAALRYE